MASIIINEFVFIGFLILVLWLVGEPYIKYFARSRFKSRSCSFKVLKVDPEHIMWGIQNDEKLIPWQFSPRDSIEMLEYQKRDQGRAALVVWAGERYELVQSEYLDFRELEWIAYELSHWLKLPLKQMKEQPAIPIALFRKGQPKILAPESSIVKPDGCKVIVLKRLSWIEILVPVGPQLDWHTYTRLFIDEQLVRQTLILGNDPPPSLRVSITALEFHAGEEEAHAFLRIWAGDQTYEVDAEASLTATELTWLAYELSSWLQLPIYQT